MSEENLELVRRFLDAGARDGRITRWEDFGSKKKAFAAAGLSG